MKRRDVLLSGGAFAFAGMGYSMAAERGFFVPAEEKRHQRTFMQWPVHRQVYPDPVFLEMTQQTIADIANAIVAFEPVTLLAAAEDHGLARRMLSAEVTLWDVPTEDLWCRDAGPVFVINDAGDLAVSQIQFNGWGEKQVNHRQRRCDCSRWENRWYRGYAGPSLSGPRDRYTER